jgi:hypothetical protein
MKTLQRTVKCIQASAAKTLVIDVDKGSAHRKHIIDNDYTSAQTEASREMLRKGQLLVPKDSMYSNAPTSH